jgi:hypothetical protein
MMKALILAIFVLLTAAGDARAQALSAVTVGPSSPNGPAVGLVPQTGINAAADTLLTAPGNVYLVHAVNRTATAGFIVLYNATSSPGTGPLTSNLILDCIALPASSSGYLTYSPGPPLRASVGAVVLITSAANCSTYTTGVITADIFGLAL